MTFLLSAAALAVVLLLVRWVATVARRSRRDDTYVCRSCGAAFSDPDQAFLHWESTHEGER